jgi:hypothetical protein
MNKRSKYQIGIQDKVFAVIEEAKKKQLPFITKEDIIKNLKQKKVKMRDPEHQVGQALFHLQKKTKYKRPRVKKFFDKHGRKLGWTTFEDKIFL